MHYFLKLQITTRCQHSAEAASQQQQQQPRSKSLDDIRDRLSSGPSFQEFVQNPQSSAEEWKEYEGKLRREKGENERLRLPPWLKTKIPIGSNFNKIKEQLRELKLATVCEEAKCPNIGECWGGGEHGTQTATIMVSELFFFCDLSDYMLCVKYANDVVDGSFSYRLFRVNICWRLNA